MESEIPSCVAILFYLRRQSLKLEKTELAGSHGAEYCRGWGIGHGERVPENSVRTDNQAK